jgi:hypothetical protein
MPWSYYILSLINSADKITTPIGEDLDLVESLIISIFVYLVTPLLTITDRCWGRLKLERDRRPEPLSVKKKSDCDLLRATWRRQGYLVTSEG